MYNIDIQSPEFVKCLEQGKQEAFQQLFETFHKALCFFAARIVRDHLEAEDIVQDVFLSFWKIWKRAILQIFSDSETTVPPARQIRL